MRVCIYINKRLLYKLNIKLKVLKIKLLLLYLLCFIYETIKHTVAIDVTFITNKILVFSKCFVLINNNKYNFN